jgi:UPF0271 protein
MNIDLNCDVGERSAEPGGEIMPLISSANIACGGHAGDESLMEATLRLALEHGVRCGAHPGYPDRANFGRVTIMMAADKLACSVYEQITLLDSVARRVGAIISHVKPHGALYNDSARDTTLAHAVGVGVARWRKDAVLYGLAGSVGLNVWSDMGFRTVPEAFADRAYDPDGGLRPRSQPGAVITDPSIAAAQALEIARSGRAKTICVHSDSPGAIGILQVVRRSLEQAGIRIGWESPYS